MSELKPCPFCGSSRITVGYDGQPAIRIYAACAECRAQGPALPFSAGMTFDFDEAWNRRTATGERDERGI